MYEAFYQLIADPFRLSPDPEFSFQHRTYRKAMTYMRHALHRAEGFIMITGQPGTGKTTLINDLIRTLKPHQTVVAKLVSTQLTADDLLDLVAYSFNLDPGGCSKANVLVQVERFLLQQYQHGRRSLLIVDEAQDMGEDALEELRLLTNLQYKNHQLLQMFLVGQEQLLDTVTTPSLEQLHQRLIAATLLEPLDADNTEAYIKHRLRRAGWKGDPLISTETYAMLRQYSQGIPRRINQICSRLFLHGSIEEKHRLGLADLRIVVEELQQEFLMPMYKEGISEAVAWPAEQFEETYQEEPNKTPPVPATVRPSTETAPRTDKAAQQPAAGVVETRRHMPVREAVADAGPGPGADNHQSSMQHRKHQWQQGFLTLFDTAVTCRYASKAAHRLRERISGLSRPAALWGGAVTVMVLITTVLSVVIGDRDSNQRARDQHEGHQESLVQRQADTQQPVLPAADDTEIISVQPRPETPDTELASIQPRPETPAPEDHASHAARDSEREAGIGEHDKVFSEAVIETGQVAVQALDPAGTSLPALQLAMVDPHTVLPAADDTEIISVQPRPETPDTELASIQPRPETPAPEDHVSHAARDSEREAGIGEHDKVFSEAVIETGQVAVQALDPAGTSLPALQLAMVDPHMTPPPEPINEQGTEQGDPNRDAPTADQETAPVLTPPQRNQAEKAADPAPVKELAVAPPLSAEEKIAGLLDHGWRSLRQDWLTVPEKNNAFHYFQRVLKLDAGNRDALKGIEQVVARYTTLATYAFDKNDKEKAEQYIERGFRIRPDNEDLHALHERMNAPPVRLAAARPLPVISAPEPKTEDFFVRLKAFFIRQPNDMVENQTASEESLELSVYQ